MRHTCPMVVVDLMPEDEITAETQEETADLSCMAREARAYLLGFNWCEKVSTLYFGGGIARVFAIFLANIKPIKIDIPEWLWVINGDIPSAYLVVDDNPTPADAAEMYCVEMRRWVHAVREGLPLTNVIPVNVPPTPDWAVDLESRLSYLEKRIFPYCRFPGRFAQYDSFSN